MVSTDSGSTSPTVSIKDPALPDLDLPEDHTPVVADRLDHPFWDRPEVHDVYREWREVADSFDPPRIFVAEAWVATAERLAAYLRADELHTAFDFDMVRAPWRADALDLDRDDRRWHRRRWSAHR